MATQQEINAFVEQIMPYFDPTPVEDDAVEQSWPRLDRGLSDVQDMTRFQQLYGIFDRGGRPFWLRGHASDAETNSKNTLFLTVSTTTGTAESTIRGAFHRVREDIELEFPAVSSPTTQYVVDEYDPVRAADGGDPIVSKVVTSLDRSQGKEYIVHWEVDRRPSQLLTDAPKRQVRPKVSPTITVNSSIHLPHPSSVLWGTRAILTHGDEHGTEYIASGADEASGGPTRWENLSVKGWTPLTLAANRKNSSSGLPAAYRRVGDRIDFRGRIELLSGAFTASESGWQLGWPGTLYEALPNGFFVHGLGAGPGAAKPARVSNHAGTGALYAFPSQTCAWIDLGGVTGWVM